MISNANAAVRVTGHRLRASLTLAAALCLLACGMLLATAVGAATSTAPKTATVQQRAFASPEEAANALVAAVRAHDRKAVVAILGPGSDQWISSGDANADRAAGEQFVSQYDAKHAISSEGNTRTLTIGTDDWPFAFPLVRSEERWRSLAENVHAPYYALFIVGPAANLFEIYLTSRRAKAVNRAA